MPATLSPTPVNIRQLHWDPATRWFSADISDTHGLGRVYPDSCDEGFTIVGATGREVVMVLTNEGVNADREITHWDFAPADPRDRATVTGATLWND